jgi:murein DD-endopeptidase MepM/ murein hydrolase activator NlpD
MLFLVIIKSLGVVCINIFKFLFSILKNIIFLYLMITKKIAIMLWLCVYYSGRLCVNFIWLIFLLFNNIFFIIKDIIVFVVLSFSYILSLIFFAIRKLFSIEDTILPTNYFIKDSFHSFLFHFNLYKNYVKYYLCFVSQTFHILIFTIKDTFINILLHIYYKIFSIISQIILLKGTFKYIYFSIKYHKYENIKDMEIKSFFKSKWFNCVDLYCYFREIIKLNYKAYITSLVKIPIKIIFFLYKLIINSILFIIFDLLKVRYLYNYSKSNKFKSASIIAIVVFNVSASIFFYNNVDLFKKQSQYWDSKIGVHNVSSVIIAISESKLLQSIKYQNIQIEVGEDETLGQILIERYDVDNNNMNLVLSKIKSAFNLTTIKPSWIINTTLVSGGAFEKNQVKRISIPINNTYDLIVESNENNEYVAFKQQKKLTRYIFRRRILISNSFYKSANKVGVPDGVIDNIYKVLSWDVDFERDVKNGDVLELVYECLYNQLNELNYCDSALYVFLNGAQKNITLYKYADSYYNSDGQSASKTLIKTPIKGARLNSNFGIRTHPVLGYAVLHKGIDFSAPTGTPILASGSGVVEKRYYSDTYGNYLKIRHNEFLSSAYAHMQNFHSKIQEGEEVVQGQIIGYVGTTGRSTGPHLHYEVLIKSRQINPLILNTPPDKVLKDEEFDKFLQYQDTLSKVIIRIPTKGKILSPLYGSNEDVKLAKNIIISRSNI